MSFDLVKLEDMDDWLAAKEASVEGIRHGCTKQIVWADGPKKTKTVIVYVHGFSATLGEVRPLPDLVASALGANLFYTRLCGHGQDGRAMGRATVEEWHQDVAEALEIGAALGDQMIVIGCSTGCTLLTTALAQGAGAKAVVHLSPNYGLSNILARTMLRMMGIRRWGRFIVGNEQKIKPRSDAHAQFWTLQYDTQAIFTMADSVTECLSQPIEAIKIPAYFAYAETDKIVSPKEIKKVMSRWGGDVTKDVLVQGSDDDVDGHVMAGDVMSPRQTAPLAGRIVDWINAL